MLQNFAQTVDSTVNSANVDEGTAAGLLLAIVLGSIIFYLLVAWILGKVFVKAGRPMWPAFVPIYNTWVLMEVSGKPGWWALINFIPYLGQVVFFVLYIIAMLELAKRFGRSAVFAVFGLIIFPIIGFIMLAFGDSKYEGEVAEASAVPAPAQ